MSKVIINKPQFGRRVVFGVDIETGKKNKPFQYDPFKHGSVEKKALKELKKQFKKSNNNKKPVLLSSNKLT